jgi:hypothetical protein
MRAIGFRGGLLSGVVVISCVAARGIAGQACCEGDLNASGDVNAIDLAELLSTWGECPAKGSCLADLDGDQVVGPTDLAELLASWGGCVFDFGPTYANDEAWQIGLEMLGPDGPLTLPQDLFDRIEQDLAAIRAFEPDLADQFHSLSWGPNQLIVALVAGQPQDEYVCLNEFYAVINDELLFQSGGIIYRVITFASNVNVEALAPIYAAAPEVSFAEPNGYIGGQNFWIPTPLDKGVWQWDIDDGFTDCFDGCDCHNVYQFQTTAEGGVELISFEQFGASWCDFGIE